jgi:hypothetical protein
MPTAFLQNFRALLPSWKFFDRVGVIPTFSYRADQNEWILWSPRAPRGWSTLFLNSNGNLELAKVSHLERVLGELTETHSAETYAQSVSYQLLAAWAREEVLAIQPDARRFAFKVGFRDQRTPDHTQDVETEDALISLEHEV